MPLAELYVVYPATREWVRGCYAGSEEHLQGLRQQVEDAVTRENNLHAMQIDIRRDCMDAVLERRRLQRELWSMERWR